MVQLRPLTLIALVVVPACGFSAASAAGMAYTYERKLERITEERQAYLALAQNAVGMSDRAFTFARRYQDTLELCMTRAYPPGVYAQIATFPAPHKGGVGGPIDARSPSRLP